MRSRETKENIVEKLLHNDMTKRTFSHSNMVWFLQNSINLNPLINLRKTWVGTRVRTENGFYEIVFQCPENQLTRFSSVWVYFKNVFFWCFKRMNYVFPTGKNPNRNNMIIDLRACVFREKKEKKKEKKEKLNFPRRCRKLCGHRCHWRYW